MMKIEIKEQYIPDLNSIVGIIYSANFVKKRKIRKKVNFLRIHKNSFDKRLPYYWVLI